MLDWIKNLFGAGKIRIEGVTEDGRNFNFKMEYTGSAGTVTEKEVLDQAVSFLLVEHGVRVDRLRIVGVYGTTTEQPDWSGAWFTVFRRNT